VRERIMNMEELWHVVVLDVSGLYARIYDEVYGNTEDRLEYVLDEYSDKDTYKCIMLS